MTVKEIRNKISKLLTDQREIALKGFNSESRSKFDRMQAEVERLEDKLRQEEAGNRSSHYDSFTPSPRPGVGASGMSSDEKRSKVHKAFRAYRSGPFHTGSL